MSNEDFENDIINAIKVLKNGGIILYPTDTIWGIGCDATNEAAAEKIFQLKMRPSQKSFVILAATEKDILQYTASPDLAVFDYLHTVTKPTTVIYEHALGLAQSVCNGDGSVAIRICKDEFCRHLIKRFRRPVVSTSANISNTPSPQNFDEISDEIKNGVDYIVKHNQSDKSKHEPSAIIRWVNGKPEVIRL